MQPKLKTNATFVHSNLRGATLGYIGLLMMDAKYATLSNVPYICPVHPGILLIPNNAKRVASYKLKWVYNDNIQVFHKVHRVKQTLILKMVMAADEQYIIEMKNWATGQFMGNIRQIFSYLLTTY